MFKNFFFSSILFCLIFSFFIVNPAKAAGASLYFSPSASTQSVGGKFSVAVKINTNGLEINAAQGTISFNKSSLKVVGISKNNSIFAFWTEEPSFSNSSGIIEFGGGIPRPGYSGNGGTVFSVVFQPLLPGNSEVTFISGDVLANDGKGTNILTGMGGASFSINPSLIPPDSKEAETNLDDSSSLLKPALSSETDPDQDTWYRDRKVKFSWVLNENIEGVSVVFDKNPFTIPGDKSDGLFDSKEYIADSDGVWYFHIKLKDKKNWGTTAHFQVKIDSTPPEPFESWSKQEDPDDWPTIFFKTVDKNSGIARYLVIVNSLKSTPYIISSDKDSLKLSDLEPGKHTVMVRAIDEAGNETFSTSEIEIRPILEPRVENYSQELSADDKFFVSGTAAPSSIIKLLIKKDGEEKILNYSINSDNNGNWSFISENNFSNGRYLFWTEAINGNGLASRPGTTLSFLVTPPVFARLGNFVINYFTVFASLLFVIVLIIFLSVLTAKVLRKRLKKETFEIEDVLSKNLEVLKSSLSNESLILLKSIKDKGPVSGRKEIINMKNHLEEKITETGKKIMKEIKDVENILK